MSSGKIFSINIEIRFSDLDALGHVNNAVFFTYFEEGRKNFSQQFFQLSHPSDFRFIMAHTCCDYLKPIVLTDKIRLQMWIRNIGTKSFGFGYKLVHESDPSMVYATGESVQVCYDHDKKQSMILPNEMKEALIPFLKPQA
jgi:acyl-CoA thioester hydrolase